MTLNCNGELIDLCIPKVMGILNTTPDSFFDGGKYQTDAIICSQVEKMMINGATFIDIGAYSTRPSGEPITETEELSRILPVLKMLRLKFPEAIFSIDTFRANVAEACLAEGAAMINDISAGRLDSKMFGVVAKYKVPYIMMHMRGTPQTMQQLTDYDQISVAVLKYFSERITTARSYGLHDLVLDPGFGFAKTLAQNYELLSQLDLFQNTGQPILVGLSRKSMIYKLLGTDPENALNGTTALNSIALVKGAQILRVHDVKEAVECIHLTQQLKQVPIQHSK